MMDTQQLIVDGPNEYGVINIWPFGKGPASVRIEVHTTHSLTPGRNIRFGNGFATAEEARQYAHALLKACEIAEERGVA